MEYVKSGTQHSPTPKMMHVLMHPTEVHLESATNIPDSSTLYYFADFPHTLVLAYLQSHLNLEHYFKTYDRIHAK